MLNLGFIIGIIGAALGILIGISVLNGTNSALVCPAPIFTNQTSVIPNPNYNTIIDNISTGQGPFGMVFNPNNNYMYVINNNENSVQVINSDNQIIDTINVGQFPFFIKFNPANNNIYVANGGDNTISVINSNNQVIATIPINSTDFSDMEFNPNNGNTYVSLTDQNGTVLVINSTNQISNIIPVGSYPFRIIYNPINHNMYVANQNDNTISVINSNNQVFDTITVGNSPFLMIFNPSNGNIYVGNSGINSTVSVINYINQVIDTIDLNPNTNLGGYGLFNPNNNSIYFTDDSTNQGTIYQINSTNQLTSFVVGNILVNYPPVLNPHTNNIYFLYDGGYEVGIINSTNQVIDPIFLVRDLANSITFNPINNNVYGTSVGTNNISVIDTKASSSTNIITKNLIPNDSCTQARNTAWTVIGILPVGLFFGLFTLFGMVGNRQ